jgi:hypothetical protein
MRRVSSGIICFFIAARLAAQNDGGREYTRLLSWTSDKYAQSYVVTIEKQDSGGAYQPYTTKNSFEAKLYWTFPAGLYRFQVAAVDVYGARTPDSPWEYFECQAKAAAPPAPDSEPYGFGYFKLIDVSLCYTPVVPLSGDLFSIINSGFYPQGLGAEAAFSLVRINGFAAALALGLDWNYLYGTFVNTSGGEDYTHNISAHLAGILLSVRLQRFLYKNFLDITVYVSGGYNLLLGVSITEPDGSDITDNYETSYQKGAYLFAAGGAALAGWHFSNAVVLRAGVRITYLVSPDAVSPLYLRPVLSIGWSFR